MTKCLDAETIAAWMDGSLTNVERAAAEAHAADCERCLAVLALVAKTAPPPQERVSRAWLSVRWLVPVATAAVALVAWAFVQNPREPLRQIDTVTAPASEPAPPARPSAESKREATPNPAAGAVATAENKAVAPAPADTRKPRESARRDERAKLKEEAEKRELLDRLARDGLVAPPRGAAPASPPPPAASLPAIPGAARQTAAAGRAGNEVIASQQFRSAMAPVFVVSPDPNVRWRIAAASVERSTDAGRTWAAQPTGTQVPLSSGASPAPGVCWIVGRAGTVLLTTDGETWRRLEFPDPNAQLVAVAARDALSATVTTTDGQTYRTDDGGKTWRLQESFAAAF